MRDEIPPIAGARFLTLGGRTVVAAFVVTLAVLVWRDPLYYFYDDALFYLQIGRSVAHGQGPEFTPGIPTNGYHPFWMLWCAGVAAMTDTRWHQLVATAWLVVAMNAAWVVAAWRLFSRHFPEPLVLAGIASGAGYVFFYSFGMESPLALLCFTLCLGAVLAHGRTPSRKALVGGALFAGLTVFARLDQAVTLPPVLAWLAWRDWTRRRDPAGLLLAAIAGALLPAAWLAYNRIAFGAFTPISGMLKMRSAEGGALPPASGVVYLFLAIAMAAALSATRRDAPARGTVIAAAVGQLGYFGYLTAAGNTEAWSWYFALLAGSMALFVPALLANIRCFLPRARGAVPAIVTAFLLAAAFLFVRAASRPLGVVRAQQQGPTSTAALAKKHGLHRVLVFDRPGMLAFLGELDVVAADGLTSNFRFQQQLAARGLDWEIRHLGVDAIAVPLVRGRYGREICDRSFFGAVTPRCVVDADGKASVTRLDFRSRLTGTSLGALKIPPTASFLAGGGDDLAIVPIGETTLELVANDRR